MKVERYAVKTCCKSMGVAFKLGSILTTDFIAYLSNNGFSEIKSFTKAGILYVESKELTISGGLNSNLLQIRCKVPNCVGFINVLEELIVKME